MTLLNLFDYEQAAQEAMDAAYYAYYAGGVADNITRRENRAAFDRLRLRPRILRDVSQVDLSTRLMGQTLPLPFMLAPAAMHKLAHPSGELGTGQAAHAGPARESGSSQFQNANHPAFPQSGDTQNTDQRQRADVHRGAKF